MKILIVDDSLAMRLYISALAKEVRKSAEVVLCISAEDALTQIDEKFDFYSLDYTLPEMSGIQLAHEIKNKHADAKMVLVTANKQEAVRNRCDDMGINMIVKPDIKEPLQAFFAGRLA